MTNVAVLEELAKSCRHGLASLAAMPGSTFTGFPKGEYNSKISDNKQYRLKAIAVLRSNPGLADDQILLWKKIGNEKLKPNSQMDVVTTLWKAGLIKALR